MEILLIISHKNRKHVLERTDYDIHIGDLS